MIKRILLTALLFATSVSLKANGEVMPPNPSRYPPDSPAVEVPVANLNRDRPVGILPGEEYVVIIGERKAKGIPMFVDQSLFSASTKSSAKKFTLYVDSKTNSLIRIEGPDGFYRLQKETKANKAKKDATY